MPIMLAGQLDFIRLAADRYIRPVDQPDAALNRAVPREVADGGIFRQKYRTGTEQALPILTPDQTAKPRVLRLGQWLILAMRAHEQLMGRCIAGEPSLYINPQAWFAAEQETGRRNSLKVVALPVGFRVLGSA